jgi:hypothetical protein
MPAKKRKLVNEVHCRSERLPLGVFIARLSLCDYSAADEQQCFVIPSDAVFSSDIGDGDGDEDKDDVKRSGLSFLKCLADENIERVVRFLFRVPFQVQVLGERDTAYCDEDAQTNVELLLDLLEPYAVEDILQPVSAAISFSYLHQEF